MFKSVLIIIFTVISFNSNSYELIKNSLKDLSSDEMEGRKPGHRGGKKASLYIEKTLRDLKISKINDSYKQSFTIFTKMEKGTENYVSWNDLKVSFEPLAFSDSGKLLSNDIVFAGFGISIPEGEATLIYDDYKNKDVKDKIVVVMTGDPAIGNPHSPFRNPKYFSYRSIYYKIKNAIFHGAKGILFLNDPISLKKNNQKDELYFNESEGGGDRFQILSGFIKNSWMDQLLEGKDHVNTTLKIQEKISKTQKPFTFLISDHKIDLSVDLVKNTGRVDNFIGFIEGKHPELKKEIIVIGAHMDHLGYGGHSSLDPKHRYVIHNGADDNASGSALLIQLLSTLKKETLNYSYLVVFFNAEESGLLGSTHFVGAWGRNSEKYGKIKAMYNFDMIGRYTDHLTIMGLGSAKEFKFLLEKNLNDYKNKKGQENVLNYVLQQKSVGSSDHAPFIQGDIPALFFTTGAHEDYHKSTDDFEKINLKPIYKLHDFFVHFLKEMDNGFELTFDPKAKDDFKEGRQRGYGAYFGCVPEFGASTVKKGVKCIRTSKDSPAEKIGITSGDVLLKLGEVEINNLYDFAFALKYYRSGDNVKVIFKREDVMFNKSVTLGKRN